MLLWKNLSHIRSTGNKSGNAASLLPFFLSASPQLSILSMISLLYHSTSSEQHGSILLNINQAINLHNPFRKKRDHGFLLAISLCFFLPPPGGRHREFRGRKMWYREAPHHLGDLKGNGELEWTHASDKQALGGIAGIGCTYTVKGVSWCSLFFFLLILFLQKGKIQIILVIGRWK